MNIASSPSSPSAFDAEPRPAEPLDPEPPSSEASSPVASSPVASSPVAPSPVAPSSALDPTSAEARSTGPVAYPTKQAGASSPAGTVHGRDARYFVVFNAGSGSGGARRQDELAEYFRQGGADAQFFAIADRSQVRAELERAADLAYQSQGTFVVAGGDGTINSALPFALARQVAFGILPGGTFNYAAREHGIGVDLKEAVQTLLSGDIREVPVGQVNGLPFLANASLGLYPRLLQDRERAKRRFHRNRALALVASAAALVSHRDHELTLEVQRAASDDATIGAPHELVISTLFVGNNALQLDRVGIDHEPPARSLTAVVLRKPTLLRLLELGARATLGNLGDAADILTFPFEKLIAHDPRAGKKGIKVAVDGEITRLEGPLVFEHTAHNLRLIAPRQEGSPSAP